ncbi:MAG: NADP-dependent oxidoreductase [Cardiobacteriaceae bacterium]|nr:NADP-dependent oxidoreductase [Cardiobacteriaceae bacterium]
MNTSKHMQAMTIPHYGKVPLQARSVPRPDVGDHDVLVAIHAASVNPIDFKIRDGKVKILLHYDMPLILGNDFAGVVVQTGKAVRRFKAGDAVYGRPAKSRIGTFAEYIAVHEDDIAAKPENLSFAQAASIPLVGLTAYQAFHEVLRLKAGDKILIHAGAGGLGTFAIQLAKQTGAYVATTASPAGHDLVQRMGADRIINYREENFADVLHGYDAVFDTLGGDALKQSFRILKAGGHIVSVSALPTARFAREWRLPLWKQWLFAAATLPLRRLEKRYRVRYDFLFMRASGKQLADISRLIEAGSIVPVIDRVFPLADAQAALDYAESGRAKGKIIIEVRPEGASS